MSRLTCLTCQVVFTDMELHRSHFKSDWHRYNLKRKVADLPSVGASEFEKRRQAHEAEAKIASGEVKEPGNYCIACRKHFGNRRAYENHINSKKHQEMILKFDPKSSPSVQASTRDAGASKSTKENEPAPAGDNNEDDMEIEEVDSDEWDEFDDDAISSTDCLFCNHHSASLDNNIKHMTEVHSFFIPDPEYLTDINGLVEYLGAKVGQGHMCLWCNEKGKQYLSVDAVQKHMLDKGHCKMLHEGDRLVEYDDFYDYSASYPDGVTDDDEAANLDNIDDSGYQLVLPSGATVGHRSLVRYYRQSLNPNRQLVVADKGAKNRLVSTYRALGWTGTTGADAVRKARDIKFIRRVQAKSFMKLGVKANRLQMHYREQNPL